MLSFDNANRSVPSPHPSFFAPDDDPGTFPNDNLAAIMKNRTVRFPARVTVVQPVNIEDIDLSDDLTKHP